MNILINHCWCFDSCWGGNWDGRAIVTIYRVEDGKSYYDPPSPDWALVKKVEIPSGAPTVRLREDVTKWLESEVKDRKDKFSPKAWCVGTDTYNANSTIEMHVFFERQMDAMRFIRRWSPYGNPVKYLNYFKDIRKKLDPKTGKLKRVNN